MNCPCARFDLSPGLADDGEVVREGEGRKHAHFAGFVAMAV